MPRKVNAPASPAPSPSRPPVPDLPDPLQPEQSAQAGGQHPLRGAEPFRLLVEGVKDYAIFMLDTDGRVVSWNPGAERAFGYPAPEIIGQHFSWFFTPEQARSDKPGQDLRRAMAEGQAEDEQWQVRKDGTRFWASEILTGLRDERGHLHGFAKVLRDVTDRKQLEDELRRQAEELKEENRRKDEFLAMLAHELRNPLAPLLHALHVMRLGRGSPEADEAWETAQHQTRHLARLVDDLLDVSRLNCGKIQLRKQPVDLATMVAGAVESSRPLLEERGHRLEVDVPSEPVRLEADPTRLEQVLANLLNNAAKFTEPGGHIWLTARVEEGQAVLRVRDSGIGIAPELLPHVFDLFTQADDSQDRTYGGLGIGLTLVRDLVEMHGGSVQGFSAGLGEGSEFTVSLPVLGSAPPAELSPPAAPAAVRPLRLLVVEDNVSAADMLSSLLELSGHQVRVAYTGAAALEAAPAYRPDLILLDINLPGMNGYQVARRLREQPGLEKAVLVAVTGYGQEADRRRSAEAGFDHHLVKPVDPDQLDALLRRVGEQKPAEG